MEYRKNITIKEKVIMFVVVTAALFLMVGFMMMLILPYGEEKPHKIYFDNGFENNFNIYIDGNIIESIGSKEIKIINITSGTHKIDIKNDVKELLNEIKRLNELAPDKILDILELSRFAYSLVNEFQDPKPNKTRLKNILNNIKETALTIGAVATPIITIAEQLVPLIQTL